MAGSSPVLEGSSDVVSEYQYYEFVALDRPLTPAEMAELRSISTRAQITPTRFFNEYHWGDLKADPAELLVRYFDVHVYFANWGSRRLMIRLPKPAVNLEDLRACVAGGPATLTVTKRHVVLDLWSETEEPEEEWFEDGQLLASLTPLRAELLRGDRRVAYLAWLLAVQAGELDPDDSFEPRVPHGLDGPSASLAALTNALHPVHSPGTDPEQLSDQRFCLDSAMVVNATAFSLVRAGVVGATGFEPVTSSVSDPTNRYQPVHRTGRDREVS